MRPLRVPSALVAVCLITSSSFATASDDPPEEITVWGELEASDAYQLDGATAPDTAADAARLLRRVPGADFNGPGPLSGQTQYRGLSSTRMNVVVDGMHINPGGPNWMDPPLHYVPRPLLDSLEVTRGIASVSSGAETLGGTVVARTKRSEFGEGDTLELHGDLGFSARSVSQSLLGGGSLSLANARNRLHVVATSEKGDDAEFDGGEIRSTEFERTNIGGGYGVRLGGHELSFDYRHNRTGEAGTPGLPLDIRFFDTELTRFEYRGEVGEVALEGRLFWTDIDHRMDNFNLRTGTQPMAARFVDATSDGFGYVLTGALPLAGGQLKLGADGHFAEHNMEVFNPNNPAFFVDNFNGARRDLYGFFAEWRREFSPRWSAEVGARHNRVRTRAGRADLAPGLPPPAQGLKDAFNASDRSETDANFDWVVKLTHRVSDELRLLLGAGRKSRSPYYIERYAWLPLEATAGLADGNNHVGDPNLDPEVSHEFELGLDWRSPRFFFAPRVFYRHVDDYIQGTPVDATPGVIDSPLEMVSSLNGDPTPLRYTNVDAKLYGLDLAWGLAPAAGWKVEGILSLVRGKRRDRTDDLYRIAPLSGFVALTHERDGWSVTVESVFAQRQDDVAEANDELETAGYAILNLRGRWEVVDGLAIVAGVENVLDKRYREHLGGFNRVQNRNIRLGERLPGLGRNFFATVQYAF